MSVVYSTRVSDIIRRENKGERTVFPPQLKLTSQDLSIIAAIVVSTAVRIVLRTCVLFVSR